MHCLRAVAGILGDYRPEPTYSGKNAYNYLFHSQLLRDNGRAGTAPRRGRKLDIVVLQGEFPVVLHSALERECESVRAGITAERNQDETGAFHLVRHGLRRAEVHQLIVHVT